MRIFASWRLVLGELLVLDVRIALKLCRDLIFVAIVDEIVMAELITQVLAGEVAVGNIKLKVTTISRRATSL